MSTSVDNAMEVDNPYANDENKALTATENATTSAVSAAHDKAAVYSPELLQMYYSRLFPYSMMYDWLSYGSTSVFSRREFSFTIERSKGDEIHLRYQSFANKDELAQAVANRRPVQIDIGAVFEGSPKDKHAIQSKQVKPEQRELVFDIDLTDYDGVRHCGCSGAKICPTCWGFMKMAIKVIDHGLREDFNFQNIAWFYSGRRGVHAWVCDEVARALTDEGRSAVAKYFEVRSIENNRC
jgi:DNA primase small subunit